MVMDATLDTPRKYREFGRRLHAVERHAHEAYEHVVAASNALCLLPDYRREWLDGLGMVQVVFRFRRVISRRCDDLRSDGVSIGGWSDRFAAVIGTLMGRWAGVLLLRPTFFGAKRGGEMDATMPERPALKRGDRVRAALDDIDQAFRLIEQSADELRHVVGFDEEVISASIVCDLLRTFHRTVDVRRTTLGIGV